jgi:hypothetical protein
MSLQWSGWIYVRKDLIDDTVLHKHSYYMRVRRQPICTSGKSRGIQASARTTEKNSAFTRVGLGSLLYGPGYVLDNVRSVPSDLTFFFGKNSFHLGRYRQSIDWLNKYIQLKGTNGQYSNEAVSWMRKAEAEFVKEKSQASDQAGEILSANYDIDCGPAGKVTCPVCKGDHVIVKKGPFGPEYKTCSYCNEHGWLTCEEYNALLRGELQPKN